jgi:hypothetical protein
LPPHVAPRVPQNLDAAPPHEPPEQHVCFTRPFSFSGE